MVEQNAQTRLKQSGIGDVPVDGQLVLAGPGREFFEDPEIGRFLPGG